MQLKWTIWVLASVILILADGSPASVSQGRLVGSVWFGRGSPCTEATVADLAWMAGSWVGSQGDLRMEEYWMHPRGGLMLGLYREEEGSAGVFFEYLRIECAPKGLVYVASPNGQPPTPFYVVDSSGSRVVFENREHDFPQRILYWMEGEALHTRIEGEQDGESRFEEFTWRRAGVEVERPDSGSQ